MRLSRRDMMLGTTAAISSAAMPRVANAWFPHGQPTTIPTGYNTLPVGAGGLVIGFDMLADGTAVAWSDVGGAYKFTGKFPADASNPSAVWQQVMCYNTFGNTFAGATSTYNGSLCMAIAPTNSSRVFGYFPKNAGASSTYALYVSNDFCDSWTITNVTSYQGDGGSNGTWRRTAQAIAVDPNNANVAYAGLFDNNAAGSGATAGAFVCTDGATFNPVITSGVTTIPTCTSYPGCRGIMFDKSSGTVTGIGGLTVTKRILLPIGGHDVYESLDGGLTFNTTGLATAAGRSDIAVTKAQMDANGVYYCLVAYGGTQSSVPNNNLWRYQSGVWTRLALPASGNYPSGATAGMGFLVVDPRAGHTGFVSVFGPNGIGIGYTSTNADGASPTWNGGTGGQASSLTAPSYDVPYLNHITTNGTGAFVDAAWCTIDGNGNCWWCGNQGVLWLFTQANLTTPVIPNYGVSTTTYSVSTSRGAEATVSQCCARPPGATYPVAAMQDVGLHQSGFRQLQYATDWYPSPSRSDATSISWAPGNPAFMAVRDCIEAAVPNVNGKSGYSTNFGVTGSWTMYTNQPDPLYQANFVGSVTSNVLTVTAVNSGNIPPGSALYYSGVTGAQSGIVTTQLTNTNVSGIPYREGTYTTVGSANRTSQTMDSYNFSSGGQVVVIDEDHHLVVPFDSGVGGGSGLPGNLAQQPVAYTTNARTTCTWQFTYDLPAWAWLRRGYASGHSARALAADQVNIGTAYAIRTFADEGLSTNAFIDNGAGGGTYTGVPGTVMTVVALSAGTTFAVGQTVYVSNVAGAVKGKIVSFGTGTGGVGTYNLDTSSATPAGTLIGCTASNIWKSTNYGVNWSIVGTLQVGTGGNYSEPFLIAVPGHAGHLFFGANFTSFNGAGLWFSDDGGATWTKIAAPTSPYNLISCFTLGIGATPGAYPTLYVRSWSGFATASKLSYGAFDPVTKTITWNTLGSTGLVQDLPRSCQFGGFGTIDGDWNTYGLLYIASGTMGFSYFKL